MPKDVHVVFFVLFTEEVTEPQLPAPLPLQTLFIKRLAFIAGEVEDGRVSPTLWYSTPPPDDIDPEADLVCINARCLISVTKVISCKILAVFKTRATENVWRSGRNFVEIRILRLTVL